MNGITKISYRIIDNDGIPAIYDSENFEIISSILGPDSFDDASKESIKCSICLYESVCSSNEAPQTHSLFFNNFSQKKNYFSPFSS